MSKYKQYLKEENLPYCTLYPNVSNFFPLNLNISSFIAFSRLGKLLEIDSLQIKEQHWKEINSFFKASDFCFCYKEAIILIQSWYETSDSYQKLNLSNTFHPDQLNLDKYTEGSNILKENLPILKVVSS